MKKIIYVMAIALFLSVFVQPAFAGAPMNTVKSKIDSINSLLQKADRSEAGKVRLHDEVKTIAVQLFDFTEVSRFTLGSNWKQLNAEQQTEFTRLYTDHLFNIYLKRLDQYKGDSSIVYVKENMLSDQKAEVLTDVKSPSVSTPIMYRLRLKNGEWRVYDVLVEGVSLVQNFRSQFNSIIDRNGASGLLTDLRKKQD